MKLGIAAGILFLGSNAAFAVNLDGPTKFNCESKSPKLSLSVTVASNNPLTSDVAGVIVDDIVVKKGGEQLLRFPVETLTRFWPVGG